MTKSALALALILGTAAGLGQAPQGWWPLTVLALGYWLSCPVATPRTAFLGTWVFGFGYFAVTLRWIVSPFLVDVAATGWMAPFALILMAAGAALFWGSSRWIAHRFAADSIAMTALLLTLAELTRSYILTGFPWALLGHIWIDTPLAQLAALGGPHLLTGITLGLATSFAWLLNRSWQGAIGPILAALAWVSFTLDPAPHTNDGPIVRLVQPNAKQCWSSVESIRF